MHALIVGDKQVGKSTLIRKALGELGWPVFGYETKRENALSDETGVPVYIYEADRPHAQRADNLVGRCGSGRPQVFAQAFERFAPKLQSPPPGCIVELDEIGFMETSAPAFCEAIMRLLDGDAPVIAAVKSKSTPFLDAVKAHPNCRCFAITPQNRDALAEEVIAFLKMQVEER